MGSEHELCSVFIGTCSEEIMADPNEISAWRWVDPAELQSRLTSPGIKFTPWFKMEWARIWRDHRDAVLALRP
jgi:isopentenyl-diphosphate delta-isomerase